MSKAPPIVVVVEDNPLDLEAVTRGIKTRRLEYEVLPFEDASRALSSLRHTLTDDDQNNMVIFLDINLPGMDGHQFLKELRNDENLKSTIVFVLTTSDHITDRAKAYEKNVAGYFVKSNLDGLLDTLALYVQNVEFPPRNFSEPNENS